MLHLNNPLEPVGGVCCLAALIDDNFLFLHVHNLLRVHLQTLVLLLNSESQLVFELFDSLLSLTEHVGLLSVSVSKPFLHLCLVPYLSFASLIFSHQPLLFVFNISLLVHTSRNQSEQIEAELLVVSRL